MDKIKINCAIFHEDTLTLTATDDGVRCVMHDIFPEADGSHSKSALIGWNKVPELLQALSLTPEDLEASELPLEGAGETPVALACRLSRQTGDNHFCLYIRPGDAESHVALSEYDLRRVRAYLERVYEYVHLAGREAQVPTFGL